ncbi:polysaccharide deacetylase family protein [Segniliparus rugosus]
MSGIRDVTLDRARAFAERLDAQGIPLSLLVAPKLPGKYKLAKDSATADWLRERRDRGDAVALHGYDQAATKRRKAEFAALPEYEARLRLVAADRMMDHLGLRTRLFAPPEWAASPGAQAVLSGLGFHQLIRADSILDVATQTVRPARLFAPRPKYESWQRRVVSFWAWRSDRRGELAQLAISGKHLDTQSVRGLFFEALDLALERGLRPVRYGIPAKEAGAAGPRPPHGAVLNSLVTGAA